MLSLLRRLVRWTTLINEWVGRAVSWLTLLTVLATFTVVVLRYLFNVGWIAMQESVIYMHALVFMLAAGYTLGHDGHVRVDVIYRERGPLFRAWVDLLGSLFLLLPISIFIGWVSWDYVAASWAVHEVSREAGGIPAVFLLKTVIPVMALLLGLQGLALAGNSLLVILGVESEEAAP